MKEILGTDDSVNACECCGKSNLKYTVVVNVDGEIKHYGSTCATKHTGKTSKQITHEIKVRELHNLKLAMAEFKGTPEYAAREAAISKAYRDHVPVGRTFADAVRSACNAADEISKQIAQKYGVRYLSA